MIDFDPDDDKIPQKLRNRFISWATDIPRLQYSQYGPVNAYLNCKFPNSLVKPQGLMREIMSKEEVERTVKAEGLEGGLEDVGNSSIVSIDSTGIHVSSEFTPPLIKHLYRTICLKTK